ncbi:Uncharacterised protein [Actinobaculum suis]|uniref:Uncharacterized protein n=1 Tax=Actinobaculum suis TaxID=1657 RepID=A0A7Z8YAR8_9ACTO|nr:hypothetical protein [Actinobaculum suis]VDG77227.1 Uncharacterised protein [Actinobaculum suis]
MRFERVFRDGPVGQDENTELKRLLGEAELEKALLKELAEGKF